ncbi:MAG: Lrp/AsnC family transcriptional regulator [Pseudomonadota bacterium]
MLSDLDEKLLSLLQRDASRSLADIAEAVNSSTATCWRRIRNLEERGILGRHVRLVDPAAVGRSMDAFCQVRMKSQGAAARDAFQQAMELEPTIVEVYSTSGEWDYLLHILVRDITDLEEILMRRVLEHPSVANTATTFALRRVKHQIEVPV